MSDTSVSKTRGNGNVAAPEEVKACWPPREKPQPLPEIKPEPRRDGRVPKTEALPKHVPWDSEIAFAHNFITTQPHLRYVARWNQWLHWIGYVWREDARMEVYTRCKRFLVTQSQQLKDLKRRRRIYASATVAAVVNVARYDERVAAEAAQFDVDPRQINTTAGRMRWDATAYSLRPPRAADYCTKSTAVAPDGKCAIPLWTKFINEVTAGDAELETYLQRVAGYCSTGLTTEQCFFFLFGPGGNGKGVYARTLAAILGDYAINTPAETFLEAHNERHPCELARMRGVRLVVAGEPGEGRRWNEGLLKSISGGDKISARFMRGEFFDFVPQCKLLFSGNHRPRLRSINPAIRRRFHMVPFSVSISDEERDLELENKLRPEWPGILHWMLEGCADWQRQGLKPPKAVRDTSKEYFATEDVFGCWLEESTEPDRKEEASSTTLYENWKQWCTARGEEPGSHTAFSLRLQEKGWNSYHTRAGNFFKKIRLL